MNSTTPSVDTADSLHQMMIEAFGPPIPEDFANQCRVQRAAFAPNVYQSNKTIAEKQQQNSSPPTDTTH